MLGLLLVVGVPIFLIYFTARIMEYERWSPLKTAFVFILFYALLFALLNIVPQWLSEIAVTNNSVAKVPAIGITWGLGLVFVIRYAVAVIVFWLLDKYEDTIVPWFTVLIGAGLVYAYIIPQSL